VYEFFWNDFCDWYIEASKLSLYSDDEGEKDRAVSLLIHLLDYSLKLMHPVLSFITEEIYQKLPGTRDALITSPFPEVRGEWDNPGAEAHFTSLQELVRGVRTLRSEFTIPPEKRIPVTVKSDEGFVSHEYFMDHASLISDLMRCSSLEFVQAEVDAAGSVPVAGIGFEAYVYIRDAVDIPKETAKLKKEAGDLEKLIVSTEKKLANPGFLSRAPQDVIEKEKEKMAEFQGRIEKVNRYIQDLS
jgi:valyl-tRNA synthetase